VGVTNGTIRNEKSFTVEVLRNGENHTPVAVTGARLEGSWAVRFSSTAPAPPIPTATGSSTAGDSGTGPRWPDRASSTLLGRWGLHRGPYGP